MSAPSLSVVICTYNGASRLRPTLEALAACQATFPVEILLVDNNSSDGTSELARTLWSELGNASFQFRIVRESKPGLSFARRRGVLEAHGDIIVFCDDDNWLDPDYLRIAAEVMSDPSIGAAGGAGKPVFENGHTPPPYFYNVATWLACGAQFGAPENIAAETVDLTPLHNVCLFGAGLIVRRADMAALLALPDFPSLPDRKGNALSSGGDYEICHLIALSGKRLIYNSRLKFTHFIPEARLSSSYLKKLSTGTEDSRAVYVYEVARKLRHSRPRARDLVRTMLRILFAKDASLDAFALAILFDQMWLVHRKHRRAYRNARTVLRKAEVCSKRG